MDACDSIGVGRLPGLDAWRVGRVKVNPHSACAGRPLEGIQALGAAAGLSSIPAVFRDTVLKKLEYTRCHRVRPSPCVASGPDGSAVGLEEEKVRSLHEEACAITAKRVRVAQVLSEIGALTVRSRK